MKNKFHQHAKAKPRKDLLFDFIRRFSDEDKQVEFFMLIKFPQGFVCDRCECHEYYLIKSKGHQERIYPSVQGMWQAAYTPWRHYS